MTTEAPKSTAAGAPRTEPEMGRVAWETTEGNAGRGTWYPIADARRFALFYLRAGVKGLRVYVEHPDGTRKEVVDV